MRNLSLIAFAAGAVALAGVARAEDYAVSDPSAFSKALAGATVQLDQGIKAAAAQGTPISAKFELDEKGMLQLSVYTIKPSAPANAADGQFSEVAVDTKTGKANPGEVIKDAGDLKNAKSENDAMAKAKMTLEQAATKAGTDNAGYRVVAIFPALQGASPAADVTLMKGTEVKKASVKLD